MLDNLQLLFVWAPIINLQVILDGIFVGAVFALSAYGLALVWGVMNIKNLAQGDFVIMGGYLSLSLHQMGIPLPLILFIVTGIMFIFGWGIYILIIRRIINQDMFVSLLATFGLSLLLQQVLNLFYGPEVQTIDMQMGSHDAFDYMVSIPYCAFDVGFSHTCIQSPLRKRFETSPHPDFRLRSVRSAITSCIQHTPLHIK